jgi:hypothetical protein
LNIQNTKKCAYCGKTDLKLTHEHILPAFIERMLPTYRTHLSTATKWKILREGTAIRDVCFKCNNGVLSDLDNYGAKLFEIYFKTPIPFDRGPIVFRYDYHKLLRWLLKLSYNDARTCGGTMEAHELLIPYIMGKQNLQLFPANLLCYLIRESYLKEKKEYLYPKVIRMGIPTYKPGPPEPLLVCRFVSFNSFYFQILIWVKGVSRPLRRRWISGLMKTDGSALLSDTKEEVLLSHGSMDLLKHINNSRHL